MWSVPTTGRCDGQDFAPIDMGALWAIPGRDAQGTRSRSLTQGSPRSLPNTTLVWAVTLEFPERKRAVAGLTCHGRVHIGDQEATFLAYSCGYFTCCLQVLGQVHTDKYHRSGTEVICIFSHWYHFTDPTGTQCLSSLPSQLPGKGQQTRPFLSVCHSGLAGHYRWCVGREPSREL